MGSGGHGPCLPSGRSLLPPGASPSPRRALAELWAAPAGPFPRVLPKEAPEGLLGPGTAAPGPAGGRTARRPLGGAAAKGQGPAPGRRCRPRGAGA